MATVQPSTKKRRTRKPRITAQTRQHLVTLLSSATAAANSYLSQNHLHLLPSQSFAISSLLSSDAFPPPHSSLLPPFLPRFLTSSCSSSSSSQGLDPQWLHFFRMSEKTFMHLLSILSPSLSFLAPSISPPYALAGALFRLAHGAPYSSIARMFSLESPSSACLAFYAFSKAVIDRLGNLYDFRDNWAPIVSGFGWISLPNCRGALGFGRFNGSIVVQALVDPEGKFLDISAGWPCSMSTEEILNKTKLCMEITEAGVLQDGLPLDLGEENPVPHYLVGDSCLPLLPWLLTPYGEDELGSAERLFNAVHERAMGLVRTAFLRVKSRWRLLGRQWKEESEEFLPFVIVVGCLLHNFLISCNEPVEGEEEVVEEEEGMPVFEGEPDESGWRIRDTLARSLSRVNMRT